MLRSWPGVEVVVAHTAYHWTWAAVARGDVDVALVGLDGVLVLPQQIADLRRTWPDVAVVVISDSTDPDLIAATVRAGARGWLRPSADSQRLVRTLYGVHDGQAWLPPDVTAIALDSLLSADQARAESVEAMAKLSGREQEILDCLAQGLTREEIGERFLLSPHTVRTHINHVLHKLGVHSTLAAVSLANKARVPG
jgi:DNA-binding NarL/FixJ family response regulator